VADYARLRDLTIIPVPFEDYADQRYAETVVFQSGRPVLIIPEHLPQTEARLNAVAVAWDFSRTAARAVADALPLLERAKVVRIVCVLNEKTFGSSRGSSELATHLSHHGVNVVVDEVDAGDRTIGDVLARFIAAHQIDLLVMGAYGHSRFREFILGGATQSMLSKPPVPTLLSAPVHQAGRCKDQGCFGFRAQAVGLTEAQVSTLLAQVGPERYPYGQICRVFHIIAETLRKPTFPLKSPSAGNGRAFLGGLSPSGSMCRDPPRAAAFIATILGNLRWYCQFSRGRNAFFDARRFVFWHFCHNGFVVTILLTVRTRPLPITARHFQYSRSRFLLVLPQAAGSDLAKYWQAYSHREKPIRGDRPEIPHRLNSSITMASCLTEIKEACCAGRMLFGLCNFKGELSWRNQPPSYPSTPKRHRLFSRPRLRTGSPSIHCAIRSIGCFMTSRPVPQTPSPFALDIEPFWRRNLVSTSRRPWTSSRRRRRRGHSRASGPRCQERRHSAF
jgi:nucleotide-binding universal stress UspA family protein